MVVTTYGCEGRGTLGKVLAGEVHAVMFKPLASGLQSGWAVVVH